MRGVPTHSKTRKVLAAVGSIAALGATAAALGGCGASAALDPVARAAQVTSRQQGARVALRIQFASSLLPSGFSITASGYVNERQGSARMSMDLSGIPGASALSGEGAGTIQMIIRYPVIYMQAPALASRLPAGKTWIKLDVAKAAQAAGIDSSQLGSLNQTDPTQFLQYLRASSGNVTATGSETLFGVSTTRYHATLQLGRVLDQLPDAQKSVAKGLLDKLGNGGAIPVDVWVDAGGRLRRMQMSIGLTLPVGSAGATTGTSPSLSGTVTVDFTSYGPVPPILAPPSSQVFDASALAGAFPGAQAGG